jgi:hypothetical protein
LSNSAVQKDMIFKCSHLALVESFPRECRQVLINFVNFGDQEEVLMEKVMKLSPYGICEWLFCVRANH